MANFQTIYEAVVDQCARPYSETAIVARAKLEVNKAIQRLQRRHAFRYTERTFRFTYPANAKSVTFSAICDGKLRDLKSVELIEGSAAYGLVLKYKTYDKIMRERMNHQMTRPESDYETETLVTGAGHSDYVSRTHRYEVFALGDQIGLYPAPTQDVTLSVNAHIWLPPLVNNSDTNFFLEYAFDVIEAMAVSSMATYLRKPELRSMSDEELVQAITTLISWDSQLHESTYVSLA